ncbi:MAG: putative bifunctional diguanylate cyclase/phosphodiesterase [Alphaproteobacteria bacterium]
MSRIAAVPDRDGDVRAAPEPLDDAPLADLLGVLIASGDLFYEWHLAADRIEWMSGTSSVLAVAAPDAIASGDDFLRRIHPEDLPRRMIALSRHFDSGDSFDCEFRVRGDDGVFRWVQERAVAAVTPIGRPERLTGVLRDIDERKRAEHQVTFLRNHDALTGHYNRLRLREALEQAIESHMRRGVQGGFLVVGIDKLNVAAEVYGEDSADAVVLASAQRIESCLRGGDIVGRVGFDRFAVVLPNCTEDQVAAVADRFLAAIREAPVATPAGPLHVTASAGATVFPSNVDGAREVVRQAESALRNARRLGCDCYSEFRDIPPRTLKFPPDLSVADQVKRALRDDRIVLAYQPVVDAGDGRPVFWEGLARMIDEDGNLVPAGAYVPIVEQMGLMRLIDRRVLDLGIATLEQHRDVSLSINVSGLTAVDPVWLRRLSEALAHRPDMAARLILEITETVALDDIDESSRFVRTLAELGCRVALDDFGAGFTSFRHLRSLNVAMVKIDGSFVRGLAGNADNMLFVRTLLQLAKGMGLTAVAEWVETEVEADILRQEGADFLQGFHCGRPTRTPDW